MKITTEKGFTLIELMLAITIVGIVVAISTGFIVDLFNIVRPSTQRMNTKQIAEIRLTEISKYARSASEIKTRNDSESNKDKKLIIYNYKGEKNNITYDKDKKEILINDKDDNKLRTIKNVDNFLIEKNGDIYEITIKVCRDNQCNKSEPVITSIVPRNIITP